MNIFRPWGHINWMLPRLDVAKYDFIGCISTEDRCTAAFGLVQKFSVINDQFFFIIHNDSHKLYRDRVLYKIENNKKLFSLINGSVKSIDEVSLFSNRDRLVNSIKSIIDKSCGNIIFDISTFPKKFIFAFIKFLIQANSVKNLVITNTIPKCYTNEPIAEDYSSWSPLPLFEPEPSFCSSKHKHLFIAIGHTPMGLLEQISVIAKEVKTNLLFPFPGNPKSFKHTWKFVEKIEYELGSDNATIQHINARDASQVFSYILNQTQFGAEKALFAPFGPKQFSLAIAIYATLYECPVYYTQPNIYHPDYSMGVLECNNIAQSFGYLIKNNGISLY